MRGGKRAGDTGHLAAPSVVKAYGLRLMAGTVLAGGAVALGIGFVSPTLGLAATLDLSGTNLTLPQPGVFGGAAFINGTDNVTNNGAVNATLTEGGGPAGTTYSGSITDGATNTTGLVHTGGTVAIIGANTYTGGTTISAGTLQIGNGGTTGSIVGNVTDDGILAFSRSDSITFGGVISGTGALQQNGTGTTILTGNNSYIGSTAVGSGTL